VALVISGLYYIFLYQPPDPFDRYEDVMKDKTIVIVATMHRVGSTKIFNAIRKIYEITGEDYYSSFIDHTTVSLPYNHLNPAKTHIIKMHSPAGFMPNKVINDVYVNKRKNFDGSNAKKIFWITAKRDLRDMVASQVRVGKYYPHFYNIDAKNFDEISRAIEMNLVWYHSYKDISDYEISYEEFLDRPHFVVEKLAVVLGKKLTKNQINSICKYLDDLGSEGTLKNMEDDNKKKSIIVDHHHITSNKKAGSYYDTLDEDTIGRINERFFKELQDLKYSN